VVGPAFLGQTHEPIVRWGWLANHKDLLWQRAVQHIQLTVVSVALGLVFAGLLATLIRRWRWSGGPITAVVTLLYAIPSIALFAALLPILGTGIVVPIVALTTYSLVVLTPFLVEAFDGVPLATVDAASGMGFTSTERFFQVELPLAVPTLIAGIRIATVTTIGLVTVGGLFDLGGFGNLIDDGLTRDFPTLIIFGVVGSVVFAFLADLTLVAVGRALSPWRSRR
jgi:osmoprotectant transport system permease protein